MFFLHGIAILLHLRSATATSTTQVTSKDISTCPSRTVNYLTHKLPQQCLTSSRSTHTSPTVAAADTSSITSDESASLTGTTQSTSSTSNSDVASSADSTVPEQRDTTTTTPASIAVTTIATVSAVNPADAALSSEVLDDESPLENSNFLSFEEWRKQNLAKAGQSEHLGRRVNKEQHQNRKRPGADHNSLDALGDDAEIDIDFSGLVPGGPDTGTKGHVGETIQSEESTRDDSKSEGKSRSKDAGTTCKERSNYASFDCGASVIKSNPKAKSPTSVLVENKDAYMLNECSASEKYLVLELCNDILIDTVVLANFEFFSSIFRHFRISVSDRYPVKADKWKLLGIYEARNARGVQAFLVENPIIFASYVRIDFLTHYGHEYYCPVSLVRIHGTTMMEDWKHSLDSNTGDDEKADELAYSSDTAEDRLIPEAVDAGLLKDVVEDRVDRQAFSSATAPVPENSSSAEIPEYENVNPVTDPPAPAGIGWSLNPAFQLANSSTKISDLPVCRFNEASDSHQADTQPLHNDITGSHQSAESTSILQGALSSKPFISSQPPITSTAAKDEVKSQSIVAIPEPTTSDQQSTLQCSNSTTSSRPSSSSTGSLKNATQSPNQSQSSTNTSTDRTKQTQSSTQSHPASPTMQDSFFKSVQKRLQMLEANSSLSLQYIEEQSRSLRDAFLKVEKRQLYKTTSFLEQLNATVLNELREFRQQYDQLWQSTVIELEMQREQYQHENQVMHARLGILADELIFQKRVSILQMTLIIICLGLVLFSRGVIHNYLELPLVQSVLSKSPSSRWMNLSGETPNNTPELRRTRSALQVRASPGILKGHRRLPSDLSTNEVMDSHSPIEINSPPTPVSFNGFSDGEQSDFKDDGRFIDNGELDFDPSMIERPSTSPPVLLGSDGPSTPRTIEDLDPESIDARLLGSPLPDEYSVLKPQIKINGPTSPSKHLKWALPE